jgi:hypothetical protein
MIRRALVLTYFVVLPGVMVIDDRIADPTWRCAYVFVHLTPVLVACVLLAFGRLPNVLLENWRGKGPVASRDTALCLLAGCAIGLHSVLSFDPTGLRYEDTRGAGIAPGVLLIGFLAINATVGFLASFIIGSRLAELRTRP